MDPFGTKDDTQLAEWRAHARHELAKRACHWRAMRRKCVENAERHKASIEGIKMIAAAQAMAGVALLVQPGHLVPKLCLFAVAAILAIRMAPYHRGRMRANLDHMDVLRSRARGTLRFRPFIDSYAGYALRGLPVSRVLDIIDNNCYDDRAAAADDAEFGRIVDEFHALWTEEWTRACGGG